MRHRTKTVMDQMNAEKPDDVLADLEAKHNYDSRQETTEHSWSRSRGWLLRRDRLRRREFWGHVLWCVVDLVFIGALAGFHLWAWNHVARPWAEHCETCPLYAIER